MSIDVNIVPAVGTQSDAVRRPRGRPPGGGNTPEQARRALLQAAEECFAERGLDITMAEVSRRAGVTRAVLYRHFSGRDDLIVGVAGQVMDRYVAEVVSRYMPTDDVGHLITESLVFVSTVVAQDPLLNVLASPYEDGVAHLLTNSPALKGRLSDLYGQVFIVYGRAIRPGLVPADVGQFVLSVALSLLIGAVPGSDEPDVVRRYVQTFVLPAILARPPRPQPVFVAVAQGRAEQQMDAS